MKFTNIRYMDSAFAAPISVAIENPDLATADFDQLVRVHQRRLHRMVLGMVRDPDLADTLTQECFLRAYQKRQTFRGECSVQTWLYRIAVNLARDHARNRRQGFWRRIFSLEAPGTGHAFSVPDPRPAPEATLLAREKLSLVWGRLDHLSPQQRAIFLLRFVEELSLQEIARITELEVGTVKSHLARAVGALRKHLQQDMEHRL